MLKIRKVAIIITALLGICSMAHADKGMWLLNELNKQSEARMRELGFKVPMDKLYSLDQPSIANGVVIFGGGCTGITVSNQALILTNHHCGYESIQSQSSVDHDYLKDGFVSQKFNEELPVPGLEVRYLKNIVDVTARIEEAVKDAKNETERISLVRKASSKIESEYGDDKFIDASVIPYYAGNKYYVVVYNVFKDVRMVFAPPTSIGKFGGDTDNWMWPRHTGDFSVFRVYANKNNEPAEYSKKNKPYTPVYFSPVSTGGYKEGDFSMTIGFPGSTDRYLTSWGVKDRMENENAPRVEVRGAKQAVWRKFMDANQAIRIKYDSKYAQSANYWKNSIGMNRGLERLKVVERKSEDEKAFAQWVKDNNRTEYANLLSDMEKAYTQSAETNRKMTYLSESFFQGVEMVMLGYYGITIMNPNVPKDQIRKTKKAMEDIYKDYEPQVDRAVLPVMLDIIKNRFPAEQLPSFYQTIETLFGGDTKAYANYLFENSVVPNKDKFMKALSSPDKMQELQKDPALPFIVSILQTYQAIDDEGGNMATEIDKYKRELFAAMREAFPNRQMPSDANFTMRLSYGSILGYEPQDGAWYNYYTTQKGVLEKENPESNEFRVQPEILELLRSGNFAPYNEGDHMNLCFLSNNDITGGNSGSPVFDQNGNLIALAFDGNWEAMSGDIEFEPDLQRTISVDIRYVMFVMDKWGKCGRLIDEMQIVDYDGKPTTLAR